MNKHCFTYIKGGYIEFRWVYLCHLFLIIVCINSPLLYIICVSSRFSISPSLFLAANHLTTPQAFLQMCLCVRVSSVTPQLSTQPLSLFACACATVCMRVSGVPWWENIMFNSSGSQKLRLSIPWHVSEPRDYRILQPAQRVCIVLCLCVCGSNIRDVLLHLAPKITDCLKLMWLRSTSKC